MALSRYITVYIPMKIIVRIYLDDLVVFVKLCRAFVWFSITGIAGQCRTIDWLNENYRNTIISSVWQNGAESP